jgi:ADP-ribosyl-[dinitrogen reductase] hydrolase
MSKPSTKASKTKSVRPLRRHEITRDDFIEHRQGAWLGQAIGDALGSTYEFTSPKMLRTDRKLDLIGGGSIGWEPGDITDDTEMALDIAKMYLDAAGYSRQHLIDNHIAWRKAGPRDIGSWTSQTLSTWSGFLQDGRVSRSKLVSNASGRRQTTRKWHPAFQLWLRGGADNAANGAIMKCVPSLLAAPSRGVAVREAEEICFDTHPDPRCTLAAGFMMNMAWLMCDGVSPIEAYHRSMVAMYQRGKREGRYFTTLMIAMLKSPTLPWKEWDNGGYVVPALQTAVSAVLSATSFEDGLMAVIERGGDADTVGAIAGVLLGARFGLAGIPQRWRDQLRLRSYEGTGKELQRLSKLRLNFEKLGRIRQDRGLLIVSEPHAHGNHPPRPRCPAGHHRGNSRRRGAARAACLDLLPPQRGAGAGGHDQECLRDARACQPGDQAGPVHPALELRLPGASPADDRAAGVRGVDGAAAR